MTMTKGQSGDNLMNKIVSLCKRRGFVYQSAEIYGGMAGGYDLGPLGADLAYNIKDIWWRKFVASRDNVYGVATTTMLPEKVWSASGHLENFTDPLDDGTSFNTMFKTRAGAKDEDATDMYFRPETAQGMFLNFKNVVDSFHPKLPFGLAQIGKAYRNEIAPREFLFRVREFEQMEVEYFIHESGWEKEFDAWSEGVREYIESVGIDMGLVSELDVPDKERAHYSRKTIDFEFDFPFGRRELYGLAYRYDYDLKKHMDMSTVNLEYLDDESGERFLPHVIEPSFGVGRTLLAVLVSAYTEDKMGDETRTYLAFRPSVAPVKAAVFPLLKNKPELVAKAREVYESLRSQVPQIVWDDNGNVGKRYRRQDEIGTPWCITVDFDTLGEEDASKKDTVTIRDRDTGSQGRLPITELSDYIKSRI